MKRKWGLWAGLFISDYLPESVNNSELSGLNHPGVYLWRLITLVGDSGKPSGQIPRKAFLHTAGTSSAGWCCRYLRGSGRMFHTGWNEEEMIKLKVGTWLPSAGVTMMSADSVYIYRNFFQFNAIARSEVLLSLPPGEHSRKKMCARCSVFRRSSCDSDSFNVSYGSLSVCLRKHLTTRDVCQGAGLVKTGCDSTELEKQTSKPGT